MEKLALAGFAEISLSSLPLAVFDDRRSLTVRAIIRMSHIIHHSAM
jgi:hypothetical protein